MVIRESGKNSPRFVVGAGQPIGRALRDGGAGKWQKIDPICCWRSPERNEVEGDDGSGRA